MNGKKTAISLVTRLYAKNFRSLEDVDVKLGPLTVLVGPNASGKSNVVDVLRFVADAFRNGLDSAIADRQGIGAIRRWSVKGRYDVEVGLEFQAEEHAFHYSFVLGSKPHGEYQVKREYFRVEGGRPPEKPLMFETRNGRAVTSKVNSVGGRALRHFISPTDLVMRQSTMPIIFLNTLSEVTAERLVAVSRFEDYCSHLRFYHLFPNQIRQPQKLEERSSLREDGGNLASVLRQMVRDGSRHLPDLRSALGSAVPGVADFQVTQVGGYLFVKLRHQVKDSSGRGAWFDLSQESDGTVRILALLAALFQDPSPSFIAVEEPELTVHPGALAVLADYLKESALRTQILITTHSPELIDRLPIESIRAVECIDGATRVGMVAEHQREAVRNELFSPGDLHRMEGLQLSEADRR
jgi:predicted ATPase